MIIIILFILTRRKTYLVEVQVEKKKMMVLDRLGLVHVGQLSQTTWYLQLEIVEEVLFVQEKEVWVFVFYII